MDVSLTTWLGRTDRGTVALVDPEARIGRIGEVLERARAALFDGRIDEGIASANDALEHAMELRDSMSTAQSLPPRGPVAAPRECP